VIKANNSLKLASLNSNRSFK